MSWWSTVPVLLAALAVMFLPGGIFGWAARLRGLALFALAPVFSVTIVSVGAIVFQLAGIRWGIIPVLVLTVVLAAVAFGVRMLLDRNQPQPQLPAPHRAHMLAVVAAVAIAAILVSWRLKTVFGEPDNISQTFDNIFHLNALQYVHDTGSASSLTLGLMTGIPFYPAAWHAVVSLIVMVSAASIPVAVNLSSMVIGAFVWPLACLYLARQVLGRSALVSVAAAVVSAAFGAFPILMVDFGVLYPNLLSIALLPACLGLVVQALGRGYAREISTPVAWLLAAAALPGLTLAHPSTLMALVAFALPAVLTTVAVWFVRHWRSGRRRLVLSLGTLLPLAVGAVVLFLAWRVVRPAPDTAFWPPVQSQAQAVGQVLLAAPMGQLPAWAIGVFTVVGIVFLLLRRRSRWVIVTYVVGGFLFVAVSAFDKGSVRDFFTGVWYNDSYRLAALLPAVTVPLAAAGLYAVLTFLGAGLPRWVRLQAQQELSLEGWRQGAAARPVLLHSVSIAVVALLAIVATQQGNVQQAEQKARNNYVLTPDAELLSSDEKALLDRLDSEVPEGAEIVGNPWTGSALAYSLADRKTLELHVLTAGSPEIKTINDHLRDARTDPSVCPAVRHLNVRYVLDFGDKEIHGGHHAYPGLADLQAAGVAQVIDQQGPAKLLKLTACG